MSKNKETGEKPDSSEKNTSERLDGKTLKALYIRAIVKGASVRNILIPLMTDCHEAPKKGRS